MIPSDNYTKPTNTLVFLSEYKDKDQEIQVLRTEIASLREELSNLQEEYDRKVDDCHKYYNEKLNAEIQYLELKTENKRLVKLLHSWIDSIADETN